MSTENFRLCQVRGSEDPHRREHERSGIILVSYNQIALYMPGVYTPIIHVFLHCPWCSQQENVQVYRTKASVQLTAAAVQQGQA